jgi:hypothetical protein
VLFFFKRLGVKTGKKEEKKGRSRQKMSLLEQSKKKKKKNKHASFLVSPPQRKVARRMPPCVPKCRGCRYNVCTHFEFAQIGSFFFCAM